MAYRPRRRTSRRAPARSYAPRRRAVSTRRRRTTSRRRGGSMRGSNRTVRIVVQTVGASPAMPQTSVVPLKAMF